GIVPQAGPRTEPEPTERFRPCREDLRSRQGRGRPTDRSHRPRTVSEEKTSLSAPSSTTSFPSELPGTSLTVEDVSAQVRTWVEDAATRPVPGPARLLSDLLRDPQGLAFTLGFVDRVIR